MLKELRSPPSLAPLYARAAITGPLHRGESLPGSVYALGTRPIDARHLAAYQRMCGFRVSDELPPTYLHVLAFPLSLALMVEQAFPFPLVGLVHVANSITVGRPVRADEEVSFTVQAADLRPHPAGRQLDLVAQARVGDETVWSGRSTYLRRGGKPDGLPKRGMPPAAQALPAPPAVAVIRVPENIGRKYGSVSGDRNPIHLHAFTAKAFGFPTAIAHGMWLQARTLATLEGRLPDAFTVDVQFKTPVLLPSSIEVSTARVGSGWSLDVRGAASGKPHLSGAVTAGT